MHNATCAPCVIQHQNLESKTNVSPETATTTAMMSAGSSRDEHVQPQPWPCTQLLLQQSTARHTAALLVLLPRQVTPTMLLSLRCCSHCPLRIAAAGSCASTDLDRLMVPAAPLLLPLFCSCCSCWTVRCCTNNFHRDCFHMPNETPLACRVEGATQVLVGRDHTRTYAQQEKVICK